MSKKCADSIRSRVFYNSSIDRKVVCGLLARANNKKSLSMGSKVIRKYNGKYGKNRVSVTAPDELIKDMCGMAAVVCTKNNDQIGKSVNQVSRNSIDESQTTSSDEQSDKNSTLSSSTEEC